ncbi:MAG: nucleotidyl transferase AbiEii/AbiGii toxin family protein [Elusimicrobia bacterium]|nr:nucleotidyl transferase AbiEii/AbiGii toxin family protein [Elusimicrobiota bacterium]
MIKRFKPIKRVLPKAQLSLWPQLKPTTTLGLVLYGGTAIALRLGHRSSVDFDFFTSAPLDKKAIRDRLPIVNRGEVTQEDPNTLSLLTHPVGLESSNVKLSFFGGLRLGRVGTPERTQDEVLDVASLDDLMATKLVVIMNRIESKDYQDIAAMISAGVRLDKGLATATLMHPHAFQPQESLRALTFFEGGDLKKLSRSEKTTLIEASRSVRDLPPLPPLTPYLGTEPLLSE